MATCEACGNLQLIAKILPPEINMSFSNLQQSVEYGCKDCGLLLEGIVTCHPSILETSNAWVLAGSSGSQSKFLPITLRYQREEQRDVVHTELEFFSLHDKTVPWTAIGPSHRLEDQTLSQSSVAQMTAWLHDCVSNHARCKPLENEHVLPRRLLHFSFPYPTARKASEPHVRLYELDGLKKVDDYACLSYCWASVEDEFITTKENLSQMKEEIPWRDLPVLYRDAIKVAGKLGLEYLWIDALCIVQNSDEDKEVEIAKMARIYNCAYVTLAAVSAGQLFFEPGQKEGTTDVEICRTTSNGVQHQVYVRHAIPHWDERLEHTDQHFPLLRRGWVYQERLLSPRVVYFSSRELLWECNQAYKCQCHPDESDYTHQKLTYAAIFAGSFGLPTQHLSLGLPSDPQRESLHVRKMWEDMVTEYTQLSLSNPKDRLPGIAGCAMQLQRLIKGRCIAGIWENSFVEGMRWLVMNSKELLPRPNEYRAPTWSWGSIDTPVTYIGSVTHPLSQVEGIEIQQESSQSTFLRSCARRVVVVGKLARAGLQYKAKSMGFDSRRMLFALRVDRSVYKHNTEEYFEVDGGGFHPDHDLNTDEQLEINQNSQYFLLQLVLVQRHDLKEYCLVLRLRQNANTYERIGMLLIPTAQDRLPPEYARPSDMMTVWTRSSDKDNSTSDIMETLNDSLGFVLKGPGSGHRRYHIEWDSIPQSHVAIE